MSATLHEQTKKKIARTLTVFIADDFSMIACVVSKRCQNDVDLFKLGFCVLLAVTKVEHQKNYTGIHQCKLGHMQENALLQGDFHGFFLRMAPTQPLGNAAAQGGIAG